MRAIKSNFFILLIPYFQFSDSSYKNVQLPEKNTTDNIVNALRQCIIIMIILLRNNIEIHRM